MSVLTDPISDFLTRIKNASRAAKEGASAPYSKIKAEVARILQEEGYIWSYEVQPNDGKPQIQVKLKYQGKTPAITDVKRVSKPGLRHYVGVDDVPRVLGGLGITILSTPKGVMTGAKARKANVGGELLAKVW
ncbi:MULTISPECIES: 30S ribosomal protein S8 [Verrucomicrobium]|jgi:small subunit ribosomal protein S8|uniref:30S ribosomal protein S8 n=1 Tax=Verrucomicrobium TaxID=2735 RepID=UPI0001744E65|nr:MULTISPECIES: 30S ribosomal protein S8 [Verrucomicrobium]